MPTLQTIRGRIVDLRRHTNVHHLYGHRPLGPSDRYELWIKPGKGPECKFTLNTRTMPARRGHDVSLILTAHKVPQVLGLVNESTIDGVNYARTDAPPLIRTGDFVLLPLVFLAMAILWGGIGMVLFVPIALAYVLVASFGRSTMRSRLARQVDRVIDRLGRSAQGGRHSGTLR